jgi:hypothetical protein
MEEKRGRSALFHIDLLLFPLANILMPAFYLKKTTTFYFDYQN